MARSVAVGWCVLLGAALGPATAMADPVEDFYRGKTVELLIGEAPGGGYDNNARLVARHLGRHIPGAPSVLPVNMTGSGGIGAVNIDYATPRRDGTFIGAPSRSVFTMPLMGVEAAKWDPRQFTWLGSIAHEDSVCIARKDATVKNWADLLREKLIVGGSAPGSDTYMFPAMLRNLLQAKFEIISGYPGGKETQMALMSGEVDATCGTYSSLKTQQPQWIANKEVNFLILVGLQRSPELPDVPSVADVTKTEEQKQVFEMLLLTQEAGRPLLAPPGIPEDRKQALRTAYDETMKDPAFLADAAKLHIDVSPMTGAEIDDMIAELYRLPPDTVDKAKRAIQ